MPRVEVQQSIASVNPRAANALGDVASAGAGFGQLAKAAKDIGDAGLDYYSAQEKARKTALLTTTTADATKELSALEDNITADPSGRSLAEEDPDYQPSFADANRRFTETADSIRDRLSDRFTDEASKVRFRVEFDRLAQAKGATVKSIAFKGEVDQNVAQLNGIIDDYAHQAARAGNDVDRAFIVKQAQTAISDMRTAGFITDVDAGKRERTFLSKLDYADARRMIAQSPDAASKALLDDKQFGNLDENTRAVLIDQAQRRSDAQAREREVAAARAERAADKAAEVKRQNFLSDLEIQVSRGQASYEAIEAARDQGMLEPRERTRLTLMVDRLQADEAKDHARIDRVSSVIGGAGVLDPSSAEDKKSVDAYYRGVIAPAIAGQPANVAFEEIARFSGKTGIVPTEAQGMIRGSLRAGDDQRAYGAADLVDRLERVNPQILNDFGAEDIALGKTIMAHVKSGASAQDAVTRARAALALPAAERKAITERYKADKLPAANQSWLGSEATRGTFLGSLPKDIPPALSGEFEDKTKFAFENMTGGNIDAAREFAMSELKRVWAVSQVGGRARWMKYAPEAIYAPQGGGEWIDEQLKADVGDFLKTKAAADPAAASAAPKKIEPFLVADNQTAREVSARTGQPQPTYQIWHVKEDGTLERINDTSGNLRFAPNYAQSPAGKKAHAEVTEDVTRLRAERAQTAELEANAEAYRTGSRAKIDESLRRANDTADRTNARTEASREEKRPTPGVAPTRGRINPQIDAGRDIIMGERFKKNVAKQEQRREDKRNDRAPTPLRVK
jgi:hypothetical protein